jgi:hypothetical protein
MFERLQQGLAREPGEGCRGAERNDYSTGGHPGKRIFMTS